MSITQSKPRNTIKKGRKYCWAQFKQGGCGESAHWVLFVAVAINSKQADWDRAYVENSSGERKHFTDREEAVAHAKTHLKRKLVLTAFL